MRCTRSGKRACCEFLTRLRDETGQSLVFVVVMMGLILLVSAFSIDVAQWEVAHHKAQVTADATALAAANCLAQSKCTQITNPGDSVTQGDKIANDNGYANASVDYAFTSSTVKVTVHGSSASAFGGLFGFALEPISGTATASYVATVTAQSSVFAAGCSSPSNPPAANCTVNCSSPSVTINANGHTNITGAIETNGYVNINIGGNASLGPVQSGQGVGSTCGTNTSNVSGSASIANGPADSTGFTSYPTTYSGVWTSASSNECTASSTYTGSGYTGSGNVTVSGGTSTIPSTITISGNNKSIGSSSTPVVMCASTSITISGNKESLSNVTLVAPSISTGGNDLTITPDPSATPDGGGSPAVAIYQTGSSTLSFSSNNLNITGAIYAPLAEILFTGNNGQNALLEGNTVEIDGNNGGDGPLTTLTAFAGSDQLIQ